jgi:predicted metal-dependent hydrolase
LEWQEGRFTRLLRNGGGLRVQLPPTAGDIAIRRALREFYEAEARTDIGRWLPHYLPGLPRPPRRVLLKPMTSQWGSLAPDDSLALDLALVLGEPAGFEYVLVHELCHLIHANHSPRFWREVESRCPDWRMQREYFHQQGRRLKASLRGLLHGGQGG